MDEGVGIYLYGGTEATLALLRKRLAESFPRLQLAGCYAPPFRPLSGEEDLEVSSRIEDAGAGIVFVGLGCPKQKEWMAAHRGRIRAVMIGVGAAFDYHAGTVTRAPRWMHNVGLEWFFRLRTEPGHLWKRYLVTNTLFILYAARQVMSRRAAER